MFQQVIFALTVKCFLHAHELPSTNLRNPNSSCGRKGRGWGTSPLQVQPPTRGREERGSAAGCATSAAETEHAALCQLHGAKPTY